jgi:hypothetical protein
MSCFFWSGRSTRRRFIGGWRWRAKRWSMWSRAVRRWRSNSARGKQNGWWPCLEMSRPRDLEASSRGALTASGHRRRVALRAVVGGP